MSLTSRPTTSADVIRARIFRFDPAIDERPRYESFEVPRGPRMRVIDVLDYVHESLARDIGYRWFCGTKKCGACAVTVNGSPRLACWEPAEPEMTIEPLRNLPVIRDLVTAREPYEELLARLSPLLVRGAEYAGFPEPLAEADMAPGSHLRDCIQCLACQGACPVLAQGGTGFAGPAPLVALAELALDPRDGEDRARLAEEVAHVFECVSCYECERVCPAEIPIVGDAIEPLKRMVYRRGAGGGARHARAFLEVVKSRGRADAARLAAQSSRMSLGRLRTGARLAGKGKVDVIDLFFKGPTKGSETVRSAYEAAEEEE